MGGDISVTSAPGRGSAFSFDVQVGVVAKADLARNESIRRVIGLQPGQPRYRLLVVDDKPDNRALLVKLLAPYNFELREARNGQEAIEIWATWEPHLIWMDLRMPVLDGIEATRRIKSHPKGQHTVIIMLSASIIDADQARALEAGCDDFLSKPFRESAIFDMLARHAGLRVVYADESPSGAEGPPPTDDDRPTAAEAVPPELLAALEQAVVTTDMAQITRLAQDLCRYDPRLAAQIRGCAEEFDYANIHELLKRRSSFVRP
jgi:CheY-like chemotaxis protein